MAGEPKDTGRLRRIVALLAGKNCGECGFQNCGRFAVALVEGKALPSDCQKSRLNLNEICQVLGVDVPEMVAPLAQAHQNDSRHAHSHHGHNDHHHHNHDYRPAHAPRKRGHHHAEFFGYG